MSPVRTYSPKRFVSSRPRHECAPDELTGDSTNWMIDPSEAKAIRRRGQTTPTSWDSVLDAAWTGNKPRGRQIIGMRAAQLADKSQHPTAYWTDDEPTPKRGMVSTLDTDQGTPDWYSLGQEFGSTHYPGTSAYFGGTGASGAGLTLGFRWCPLWTNQTIASPYSRGITSADRQNMFGGGRQMLEVGEWLFGVTDATPYMWRKTWNFASGSGTNVNRLQPWGHRVPLYHPVVTAGTNTASVTSWREGRTFYYSTAFIAEDGSIGPFTAISDAVIGAMTDGTRGRFTIPTAANDYYTYIRFSNLPRPPKGYVGLVIARTQQTDATTLNVTYPGPNDLRIVAEIRSKTQTVFDLYDGDDRNLLATPDLVRIDHKWPRRAKYLVANNNRFLMCGSLKLSPAAIIIAPTGISATRDINATGSSTTLIEDPDNQRSDEYLASPGTRGFFVQASILGIKLSYRGGSGDNTTISATSGGNYRTLQDMVDEINQTTIASVAKEWAAHLAPGVDGGELWNTMATMSGVDLGDESRTTGASNHAWVRGPADPVVLYFSKVYMDSFPTDDQSVEYTRGGPSDTPSAIFNWSASGATIKKPGDAFVGRCLGAAPLDEAFIVFYEHGVYRLAIPGDRDETDENMRLIPLVVGNVNVVSDSAHFWGDGYAGTMTMQGILVTDGTPRGTYILPASRDVFNSEKIDPADDTRGLGEWKNEIARSLKSTAAGGRTTADDESFLYGQVMSDQLWLTYRKTATAANDRAIALDMSSNADRSGLGNFIGKDGEPLGFGCPLTTTFGAMAEIVDQSGGMVRYGIVENIAQGRIDKFDAGTTDNGAAVPATGYFATDFMDTPQLKEFGSEITTIYRKSATGLSVVIARDQGTSPSVHGSDTFTIALDSSGTLLYARDVTDLQPEARTAAEVCEPRIVDDGSGSPSEVWSITVPFSVRSFPR